MKSIATSQLLATLEARVDRHLERAISLYQNLTDLELNRASPSGGWSIAQCLEHLNSYGDYYLPQIRKAINTYEGKPSLTTRRGWLGNYFVNMMDPDVSNKGYKAFKGHIPDSDLNGHQVVARFIQQQEDLLLLLRKAEVANLELIRIPISITRFIRLRLGDTFEFMIMHDERHIRQADRNFQSE